MKKFVFAIGATALSLALTTNKANAQWTASGSYLYPTTSTVNVGINDNAPSEKLSIDGKYSFKRQNTGLFRTLQGNAQSGGLALYANQTNGVVGNPTLSAQTGGASIVIKSNNPDNGTIAFIAGGDKGTLGGTTTAGFDYLVYNNGAYDVLMRIMKNGKVALGNAAYNIPGNYRLYVADGIMTEKVKVAVLGTGQWSDYVFADNYNLKPLDEVESYIGANKHLPDVPSAQEMVNNGLDVATMDAKLLQKIEELTLYVIDQQKQIKELKNQMNK